MQKSWRESLSQPKSQPTLDSITVGPMDVIRILRHAGGALFAQASLHGQMARVEWAEEKNRLLWMLVVALVGFSCLLCLMLFIGVLVLALSWQTAYQIPAMIALVAVYGFGTAIACWRFQILSALSSNTFAVTREELAADIAMIKSKL